MQRATYLLSRLERAVLVHCSLPCPLAVEGASLQSRENALLSNALGCAAACTCEAVPVSLPRRRPCHDSMLANCFSHYCYAFGWTNAALVAFLT